MFTYAKSDCSVVNSIVDVTLEFKLDIVKDKSIIE